MAGTVVCVPDILAQAARSYGVGRSPTETEIRAWGIDIGPNGENRPPGGATPALGRTVYLQKCARCHGPPGVEGPDDRLAGGLGTLATDRPVKTVGNYWPYATTLWDDVNRAMPFDQPGSLAPDEVYASVAYVLFLNTIIGGPGEHTVVSRATDQRGRTQPDNLNMKKTNWENNELFPRKMLVS